MPVKTVINIVSNPWGLAILCILMVGLGATSPALNSLVWVGGLGLVVLFTLIAMNQR